MSKIRIPRHVVYILIVVISGFIGVIVGIVITKRNEILNPISHNDNFVYLKSYEEPLSENSKYENYVFTNYEDYYNTFKLDTLTEKDFKNNNYILIPITYDSCSESEIIPTSYDIKDNKVSVTVSYKASCGLCPVEYMYYLLEVDKSIENIELEIKYKARNNPHCDLDVEKKPMIYLYPEEEIDVTVVLGKSEKITTSYPEYKDKWQVNAKPDGTLTDSSNRKYYGLFWEGNEHQVNKTDEGFVVAGSDIVPFLEEKLAILGLTDKEANEFIVYWLPTLKHNKYNYIRFETMEEINNYMPLEITPTPDSVIRILMDYKPLESKISIEEQELTTPTRTGFTVVEWGGSLIR